jgi:uroporphyrinogen-III decarboxylase
MPFALNPASGPFSSTPAEPAATSRFVRACLRQTVDRTPVWFLRQAGRYMPEYMAVRKHHTLLDICRTPEVAAEVTITAAERLGVDAAIIFADLLLPFTPMGLDFEFVAGEGPVVHTPIRTLEQVESLQTDRIDELSYVARSIEKVAAHFSPPRADGDQLGIIGFIGAPFTLASYMIEGGSSRNYIETKKLMYASGSRALPEGSSVILEGSSVILEGSSTIPENCHPDRSEAMWRDLLLQTATNAEPCESGATNASPHESPLSSFRSAAKESATPTSASQAGTGSKAWPLLMEKLLTVLTGYAQQQVDAGADVIQIFDSWAGALSVPDYTDFCLAPTRELVRRVQAMGVPVIYFGVDTASLLPTMRSTGADVIGLDWRVPLDTGWSSLNYACAVQGNLDPITLFAPEAVLKSRVDEILRSAAGRPGHIFNLGHGIVPGTPVDNVIQVVQWVKDFHR